MLLETACPRCKAPLSIDATFVGTKRTCPACKNAFVLERPSAAKRTADAAVASAGAAKKPSKLLAVELKCEQCQHPIRVDTSFAGAKRTCPNCEHVFTVTLPAEVQAQVDARREAKFGQPRLERTACPKCYRFGSAQFDAPIARCVYCAAPTPFEQAVAFGRRLDSLEEAVTMALLIGRSDGDVSKHFAADGEKVVGAVIARKRGELTLIRKRALAAMNRGATIALRPPPACERCFKPSPLAPYSLTWSRVEEETQQIHGATALTFFAGVAVTETKRTIRVLEEVAYLCEACHRARVPPALGFTRDKSFALPAL